MGQGWRWEEKGVARGLGTKSTSCRMLVQNSEESENSKFKPALLGHCEIILVKNTNHILILGSFKYLDIRYAGLHLYPSPGCHKW